MRSVWPLWKSREEAGRVSGSPVCYAIVEPGTSSMRLLVAEVAGGQATVWGWHEWAGCAGGGASSLLAICEETLAQAEAMAQELAGRKLAVDQVLVGLPASQLRGRAWSKSQQRTQPEGPVEEWELEGLLRRVLRLAVNRLLDEAFPQEAIDREQPGEAESGSSRWLLVDASTVALTVNGQRVTDPVGFRAQQIGASVFAALAAEEVIETWRLVAKELAFSTLTLTAAPLALTLALLEPQGVLLDVGGATTDLTLWRAGGPLALDSVPIGADALTGMLVREWDLSPERAERLKWIYASGQLDDQDRARVKRVRLPALKAWLEGTETALVRMNREEPLPRQLYLLGGGSALPDIVQATRTLAWSERLHFERYPLVEALRPSRIPNVINRTTCGRGAGDVSALALAAWAAGQAVPPGRPARILGELCLGLGSS
jgi:cell division protein FtsA